MQTFDQYGPNYRDVVQRAIDFAGLEYEFFVKAKARIIKQLATRFDRAADVSLLDVGCGVGILHDHLGGTCARNTVSFRRFRHCDRHKRIAPY